MTINRECEILKIYHLYNEQHIFWYSQAHRVHRRSDPLSVLVAEENEKEIFLLDGECVDE